MPESVFRKTVQQPQCKKKVNVCFNVYSKGNVVLKFAQDGDICFFCKRFTMMFMPG